MSKQEIEHFYPKTKQHWRKWLEKNHVRKDAVWLIHYKQGTGKPTIDWSSAVDEALCFGWIDSKGVTLDEVSFIKYYCKRKPNSTWSKVNKQKIEILTAKGLMMPSGISVIEIAKQNGSWTTLDEVEELIIPKDLSKAFRNNKGSEKYFLSLSKSKQKSLLQWIVLAKQPQTRQKRIDEIALCASEEKMPKHLQ